MPDVFTMIYKKAGRTSNHWGYLPRNATQQTFADYVRELKHRQFHEDQIIDRQMVDYMMRLNKELHRLGYSSMLYIDSSIRLAYNPETTINLKIENHDSQYIVRVMRNGRMIECLGIRFINVAHWIDAFLRRRSAGG